MSDQDAKLIDEARQALKRVSPFAHTDVARLADVIECLATRLEALAGGSRAEATEAQVEAAARVIAPGSWRVMDGYLVDMLRKHNRGDAGYDPAAFKDKESMAIARRVLNEALATRDHQIALMVAVLKPFADAARDADERGGIDDCTCPDDYPINEASDETVTLGHCRAARALSEEAG
jgi:hypothetical protein